MIQDIFPHQLNNSYRPDAVMTPEDAALCFGGPELVLTEDGQLPCARDFGPEAQGRYLFCVDALRFFLMPMPAKLPEGFQRVPIQSLRKAARMPAHMVYAAVTGKHLADWYRDAAFCGRCGAPMEHSKRERAMVCPHCGFRSYPRIMPAVIVGVTDGDSLLITRYREGFRYNALIAGFTEIGETLEQTVAREVMEEAGLRVKNIRYYKSQPWGFANDILMGFFCDVDGDATIHMDDQELKQAMWVPREQIELQPDRFSLTNEMMEYFQNGGKLP